MPRVVLDTNVLLSGIAYPASIPGKILAAWRNGSVEVLLSDYILDELRRVLPRLAHRHGLTGAEIDDADELVLDTLLAALNASKSDYLITGDKDLLAVADRYPILTSAQFWSLHGGP